MPQMSIAPVALGAAAALAFSLSGCTPTPSTPVSAPAVVTFEVAKQGTFSVRLDTQALVDHAVALKDGGTEDTIPLGTVEQGDGGVNAPWTWHLDPATFEFVGVTTEVCDGLPQYVEDGTVTSPYYCPWSADVLSVTPLTDAG